MKLTTVYGELEMTIKNAQQLHEAITLDILNCVQKSYTFADAGSKVFLEDTGWTIPHAQAVFAGLFNVMYCWDAGQLMECYDGVDCIAEASYKFAIEDCNDMTLEEYVSETASSAMSYACSEPWNAYFDMLTGLDKKNTLGLTQELAQKVVNYLYDAYTMEEETA